MFGYVRAYKPYMRMFEYDIYRAVYCGLCKDMGRSYGQFTRLTLSYDLTFLALVDFSVHGHRLEAEPQRCVAHPFTKRPCATCGNDYTYTSAAAVLLVYHKLRDDLRDSGFWGRLKARLALPFFSRGYKKAKKTLPELSDRLGELMGLQTTLERERCKSIDQACEPTALMMQATFSGLTQDPDRSALLGRMGYLLGRYIYMTDALDDVKDDYKKGSYNPLLESQGLQGKHKDPLSEDTLTQLRDLTDLTVDLTLGELGEVYSSLDLKRYRDILDNIVYLGLKNTYGRVKSGKSEKESEKSHTRP